MNKLTKWVKSHKPHTAVLSIAIIAVIALLVAGATGVFSKKPDDTEPVATTVTTVTTKAPTTTEKTSVTINVTADAKVTAASTPVIMHVQNTDKRQEPVAFYHAVDSGVKTDTIEVLPGEYKITVTGVINNDGSVAKPEAKDKEIALTIKSTGKTDSSANKANVKVKLAKTIPADKVTTADIKDISTAIEKAIEKGDKSLQGNAGKAILEKVKTNTKANANISEKSKKAVETSNKDAAKANETQPETSVTTAPNSTPKTVSAPESEPESEPETKPETTAKTGHYETRTRTVQVPRQVTEQVLVKDEWPERVFKHELYHFVEDGFETTDPDVCRQHRHELVKKGFLAQFTIRSEYELIMHPAEYETVTKTVYDEQTETYEVWVED